MKLLYEDEKWKKIASALENVNEAHKYDNKYEDADELFEDSKGEIAEKDVDGAISFNPKTYQPEAKPIRQNYKKLYNYAKGIGKIIDEKVDTPFYEAIDEYIQKMTDLNVTAYQTANTINVQEGSLFSGAKDKITLNDLYDTDTIYSAKLKTEFETWKIQNPSETASEEDYRTAALNSGAFEYEGIRAGQEKKEFWFNLIATGVVVGLAIVCPPAGLAAGVIYTTIDAVGAVKGEDLISGRKLSDEERMMRGAFAIVPGAGGLAAKSLLKHMPALGTVMKTVSKTMDDAVKPIKTTVDNLTITGKQAVKTTVAKTQQQALKATDSVKSVKQSMETSFNKTLEHAKQLGKAHIDQLKFALTHPIIATVTSKEGQKSIRGTAKFIDNVFRPVEVRTVQTTTGNKVFAGFERGESSGKLTEKAENYIAIKQAEKDAIKESKGTGNTKKHLDDVPRIKEIEVNFNRNVKHDSEEFARQLKDQEKGMNELTVDEYLKNRERYIAEGRALEGNVAQQTAREEAFSDKLAELMANGKSFDEAEKEAKEWLNTQAALHNPDQIAGGKPDKIGGMGHKGINSSIGSQWRYRIDVVDEQIREMARSMTPGQLKNTYLNVKLTH
ncbi:polymorphic toxin type 15 domain-containing protein [Rummeliibacillus sp. POC4]|uniref:polymorphic toxin type 15 domain-containing protein n=1 Tax=Rummeliibacillus sp. POC4 TaxID=2305899 RepID=UPI000E66DCBB|nr:polymorphic toxin type 15 domain-containing protein [Rummeliibacillus sp. POC4]RIJ63131.1 hypothetical protein D1606_16515 [Rummeliibacillus sp. POC4]